MEFRTELIDILTNYGNEIANNKWCQNNPKQKFAFNLKKTGSYINSLSGILGVSPKGFAVEASAGAGGYTYAPWIRVFERSVAPSAQGGIYIVYLLSYQYKKVYLSLAIGGGDGKANKTLLSKTVLRYRSYLPTGHGLLTTPFKLALNETPRVQNFSKGTICYKEYDLNQLNAMADDGILLNDLYSMINIYGAMKNMANKQNNQKTTTEAGYVSDIINYIKAKGFHYSDEVIKDLYLSLITKPFVILAGVSGTGKSKLVRLFSEATNSEFRMISVKPDWSDASDLIGHQDLNGVFKLGPFMEVIREAHLNKSKNFIVCLDEMNLARVEYYLSDFLSIVETRRKNASEIVTDAIVSDSVLGNSQVSNSYRITVAGSTINMYIPQNLFVVGTVNMDETTFPFSLKVLDRAHSIEFSDVDLTTMPNALATATITTVPQSFLHSDYILLSDLLADASLQSFAASVSCKLNDINVILKENNMQFGYRIRDEISFYLAYNKRYNLMSDSDAFDLEVLQKILPRIKGTGVSIKRMLNSIIEVLEPTYKGKVIVGLNTQCDYDFIEKAIKALPSITHPRSVYKILFMIKRLEEDDYTSFWF